MTNQTYAKTSKNELISHERWITFQLARERYAIDVKQVQEVLLSFEHSSVPGAPSDILGIINLRGIIVPVINTRKKLGLAEHDPKDSRIIILESKQNPIGILVDHVNEVVDIDPNEIDHALEISNSQSRQYISGLYHNGNNLIILINAKNLTREESWGDSN